MENYTEPRMAPISIQPNYYRATKSPVSESSSQNEDPISYPHLNQHDLEKIAAQVLSKVAAVLTMDHGEGQGMLADEKGEEIRRLKERLQDAERKRLEKEKELKQENEDLKEKLASMSSELDDLKGRLVEENDEPDDTEDVEDTLHNYQHNTEVNKSDGVTMAKDSQVNILEEKVKKLEETVKSRKTVEENTLADLNFNEEIGRREEAYISRLKVMQDCIVILMREKSEFKEKCEELENFKQQVLNCIGRELSAASLWSEADSKISVDIHQPDRIWVHKIVPQLLTLYRGCNRGKDNPVSSSRSDTAERVDRASENENFKGHMSGLKKSFIN